MVMNMPMNTVSLKIDGDRVAHALQEALEKLDGAGSEVVLDFSSVRRIDPSALRAMEGLAGTADDKDAKVVLRGVNVDIYKVLKLTKLASRFSFLTWDEKFAHTCRGPAPRDVTGSWPAEVRQALRPVRGLRFLDSPAIGLFEGFQFQIGVRPTTWYSVGFDHSISAGHLTLTPNLLTSALQQQLGAQLA
jgi:anti-anti-sigma regulatory factor